MSQYVHAIVHFAEVHAGWIYLIALAATCLESIAVIGLIVPGSGVIVALGALVPSGAVGFWWLCLWSIVGALCGDGFSYWVGYHFGDRIKGWWPLRNHPDILVKGEAFFAAHGGKSVFLSRFVAPVRGGVPLIAGMAHMSPLRFFVANVLSALGWAPAHILPGALMGAGLTLTGAMATRLLVLTVVLVLLLWLVVKLTILAVRRGRLLLIRAQRRTNAWARQREGWLAQQVLALLDPHRNEARTLALSGFLLAGAAAVFFEMLEDVVTGEPLVRADTAIYNVLQGLRSQFADRVMIAITELGGGVVAGAITVAVLLFLVWRRAWHAAGYWVAAVGGASLIGLVIKAVLHRARPIPLYSGWDAFSFPSGHATTNMAIYGFLAVLLMRDARPVWQAVIAAVAALMVTLIGFSRLYLGAHWFSDVVGGMAFGMAWVSLLAIAYVRHERPGLPRIPLAAVVIAVVAGVGSLQVAYRMPADHARYAQREAARVIDAQSWWESGWHEVALRRIDLVGELEEPLVLQWAGPLDDLTKRLTAGGWQVPKPWSVVSAEGWLDPSTDSMALPVLPRLHDGHYPAQSFIRADTGKAGGPAARWVLRIWKSGAVVVVPGRGTQPLWVGAITLQRFHGAFAPFDLGFEDRRAPTPWPLLTGALGDARQVKRTDSRHGIQVLLAHGPTF